MNQGSNQYLQNRNIRQISQEEIDRARGMTQEELQRTQVLNLKDFEEVASFERRTSKKPAIIIAIIGIISIAFGSTFSIMDSMSAKKAKEQERQIERRKVEAIENKPKIDYMNCTSTYVNNPDGTDIVYNIKYSFKDEKLSGFEKKYSITQTPGNALGLQTLKGYVVGYQSYTVNIEGYNVAVASSDTSVIADITVDLEKVDITKVPEYQQTHPSTKIDYYVGTQKEVIMSDMASKGFICQ